MSDNYVLVDTRYLAATPTSDPPTRIFGVSGILVNFYEKRADNLSNF